MRPGREVLAFIVSNGFEQHYAIAYGDVTDSLLEWCRLTDVKPYLFDRALPRPACRQAGISAAQARHTDWRVKLVHLISRFCASIMPLIGCVVSDERKQDREQFDEEAIVGGV